MSERSEQLTAFTDALIAAAKIGAAKGRFQHEICLEMQKSRKALTTPGPAVEMPGARGLEQSADITLGVTLMAPNILFPMHNHILGRERLA